MEAALRQERQRKAGRQPAHLRLMANEELPRQRGSEDARAHLGSAELADGGLEDRVLAERFLGAREKDSEEEMEAAFRMLLLRYQERVHKLVHRYTKDSLEAEDVTQEVFLKVFRKLDGFQWDSALYTWIYRIAVNTAVDYMGKKKRRPVQLSENVGDLSYRSEEQTLLRGSKQSAQPPEEPLFEKERARVTRELLEELPEQYKTVLVLREFEDLSYVEISETLSCSLGTVESRLFRARARFRHLLEQKHPELLC